MTPYWETDQVALYHGDCREVLAALPEQSVQCVVTSPPYWGLRDYQVDGQLGLEKTPDEYVANMVEVFRGVRRVLRDDGVMWLNCGDSYCNAGSRNQGTGLDGKRRGGVQDTDGSWASASDTYGDIRHALRGSGIKHKDLLGMPWRLAFALQADGWWLRSEIIWAKPSPMPESVTDRPTKAHEQVFLLTKAARYFYDADGVREAGEIRYAKTFRHGKYVQGSAYAGDIGPGEGQYGESREAIGRNLRTVWTIPSQAFDLECCRKCMAVYDGRAFKRLVIGTGVFSGQRMRVCPRCQGSEWASHFATFPEKLVEPCVKAGTSEKGCCPECGAAWVRVVEKDRQATRPAIENRADPTGKAFRDPGRHVTESITTCWRLGCKCWGKVQSGRTSVVVNPKDMPPCTVLDPFAGSSTVGVVCQRLGRRFIGIELSETSLAMSKYRLSVLQGEPTAQERDAGQATLFDAEPGL